MFITIYIITYTIYKLYKGIKIRIFNMMNGFITYLKYFIIFRI